MSDDSMLVVDCQTGQTTVRPLTQQETAARQQMQTEQAAARQARDAADAVRTNAVKQLKAQARANGKVDATVIAQLLGIDPNAPDPIPTG